MKAFLNLEVGLTRGAVPSIEALEARTREQKNKLALSREQFARRDWKIKEQERKLATLHEQLARRDQELAGQQPPVYPGNIIWIFGTARTGSTWLASMMRGLPKHLLWDEPLVGEVFGRIRYPDSRWQANRERKDFIFGKEYEKVYTDFIRSWVLKGAAVRFPNISSAHYVVVKEPHGSSGAPILMEAFPESRMIFLVRDPRDVAASGIDAHTKGGWATKYKNEKERMGIDARSEGAARQRAEMYLRDVSAAKEAYEAHEGRKILVRYEDLRFDTLNVMKRICSELEIPAGEENLARVVEDNAWENVPDDLKGAGKGKRKTTPGGWKEDLDQKQIEVIETTTAPLLKEFYGNQ